MSQEFNPEKLMLALARRKMKLKELSESIGISTRSVSLYKNGHETPSEEIIKKIATTLRFPKKFFYGCSYDNVNELSVSFRAMSKMSAPKKDAALASGTIAMQVNEWIEARFQLPKVDIPNLREPTPESAAEIIRNKWFLGEFTIKNMIHLLESKGVRVFSLAENNREVDAYSFWKDNQPFVFLNTMKSAERSRFDAAHELGHLVLHKHGAPNGKELEREADQFASALLMPAGSVKASAVQHPTLEHLIKLKNKWVVSLAALVRRQYDLELISEWHYRSLNIQMSKLGFLKKEPEGAQRETSMVLDKVLQALWKEGMTRASIAKSLDLPVDEIDNVLFNANDSSQIARCNPLTIVK